MGNHRRHGHNHGTHLAIFTLALAKAWSSPAAGAWYKRASLPSAPKLILRANSQD
jgi:hypothetical protein